MQRPFRDMCFIGLICCLQAFPPTDLQAAATTSTRNNAPTQKPQTIIVRRDASALESLAATEVARYVYLRTGEILAMKRSPGRGNEIVVCRNEKSFCGELGQELGPQQFMIQTRNTPGKRTWWIIGGDDIGTLYGAYRFAEKLGVQFGLEEDAIPDQRMSDAWPEVNEIGKPRFTLRGLQPFHDFSVGPDWWNAHDYRSVLSQMAKLRLNFIGLHTYPSWNPAAGPEANVWIGLPEDVDAQGNVTFGYEAGVVTTRRGWAVTPFPTSQYAAGAGLLFESDDFGPEFISGCLEWPRTPAASAAMFNRYGDFQKDVFGHGRRLGVKTCVGTELPLGVPKELGAHLESQGMDPNDPAVIQRLYEGTFTRLMRKVPIDYYWFWIPEVWLSMEPGCAKWEMTSRERTEKDLTIAARAVQSLGVPFGLATAGWRLGTREDPLWTDKRTPKSWAASSINTHLGRDPVEPAFGKMPGRPKWVIGWAEDDGTAGAHCCTAWDLQLWVARMLANSAEAFNYGCEGMMAIHWRTAAIAPNIAALSRAGWDYEPIQGMASASNGLANKIPDADTFWAEWGRGMFGFEAGAEVARALQQFDGGHLRINELISGGAKTTDQQIEAFFAPAKEMAWLRGRIRGPGSLDRFDYWLNSVLATELRVRTWVMSNRLGARVNEAKTLKDTETRRGFASREVLPLRLAVARSFEDMIGTYVACAKSPGEVGTISSIENGMRTGIVFTHDKAIAELLGAALPPEAAIRTVYRGTPKIFVSSKPSQVEAGKPWEIRASVLSAEGCQELNLHWRAAGKKAFRKVPATHRSRQAYAVMMPPHSAGIMEYYLEARLENGERVKWPGTAPMRGETVIAW